jgi:hypothetical protein
VRLVAAAPPVDDDDLDDDYAVYVHDTDGVAALPPGTRLSSTADHVWVIGPDQLLRFAARSKSPSLLQKGWKLSELVFAGGRSGHRVVRRVLNPEILGEFVPEPDPVICPECRAGKCGNCPEQGGFDPVTDLPVPCACWASGHPSDTH